MKKLYNKKMTHATGIAIVTQKGMEGNKLSERENYRLSGGGREGG